MRYYRNRVLTHCDGRQCDARKTHPYWATLNDGRRCFSRATTAPAPHGVSVVLVVYTAISSYPSFCAPSCIYETLPQNGDRYRSISRVW